MNKKDRVTFIVVTSPVRDITGHNNLLKTVWLHLHQAQNCARFAISHSRHWCRWHGFPGVSLFSDLQVSRVFWHMAHMAGQAIHRLAQSLNGLVDISIILVQLLKPQEDLIQLPDVPHIHCGIDDHNTWGFILRCKGCTRYTWHGPWNNHGWNERWSGANSHGHGFALFHTSFFQVRLNVKVWCRSWTSIGAAVWTFLCAMSFCHWVAVRILSQRQIWLVCL